MYRRLFIAEKPSVAQAIAAHLSSARPVRRDGFIEVGDEAVTWCFGHLLEQAPPEAYDERYKRWSLLDLPIAPQDWKLLPKEDAKKQLKTIGALLKESREVINAGDPDREGELLVREVLEHHRYSRPTRRLWLAAMDEKSVRKALAELQPGARYDGMYRAALARARADWLVGMNCTRAMTVRNQEAGGAGVLSVGRVQSPTLALVVRRDLEIEQFVSREYFELYARLQHPNGTFRAKWKPSDAVATDEEGRVLAREPVQRVAKLVEGQPGLVKQYSVQQKKEAPPLPFSLSSLQSACSARFGLGAQKVLDIAQALYEKHKLTSYPRTDCQYLPESQWADASAVLATVAHNDPALADAVRGANAKLKSGAWNDKKVGAHHGIVPTQQRASVAGLAADERRVYELICRHYLAQFYPEQVYNAITVLADVRGEAFAANGRVVLHAGWRALFARPSTPREEGQGEGDARGEGEREEEQVLPVMASRDPLACTQTEVKACQTKPPARYTEGTLIRAMANAHQFVQDAAIRKVLKEKAGIGTEATRAGIIETLKRREFLAPKGKQILSTEKGRQLIRTVSGLSAEIVSPELTALFEQKLSAIEEGENDVQAFLEEQLAFISSVVGSIRAAKVAAVGSAAPQAGGAGALKCPACEREGYFRRVKGPRGQFWGCAGYRDGSCRFTAPDKRGKPDLGAVRAASPAASTPKARSTQAKSATTAAGTAAGGDSVRCPTCSKGLLRRTARKDGSGYFWGCTRWREGCKFIASDRDGKPLLPKS